MLTFLTWAQTSLFMALLFATSRYHVAILVVKSLIVVESRAIPISQSRVVVWLREKAIRESLALGERIIVAQVLVG